MTDKYVLVDHKAVQEPDVHKWGAFMESKDRVVKQETIGNSKVSTVFLGLDHQFGEGPPMLFETMVFGGALDSEQDRCTTWTQAEDMHRNMVRRVKESQAA